MLLQGAGAGCCAQEARVCRGSLSFISALLNTSIVQPTPCRALALGVVSKRRLFAEAAAVLQQQPEQARPGSLNPLVQVRGRHAVLRCDVHAAHAAVQSMPSGRVSACPSSRTCMPPCNLPPPVQLGWLLTSSGGAIARQRRQRKAAAAAAAAEAKDFHEQMAAGREGRWAETDARAVLCCAVL